MQNSNFNQVAEITLTYKANFNPNDRPQISSSKDSYNILISNWSDQIELREEFNIILLNNNGRVLGIVPISTGGVSSVLVDPKLVFASALKAMASSIILAHNHPSGILKPSYQDISITKKLKSAGGFLDINVFDHLIITPFSYFSFADEDMM